jgi:hypothetical protein
MSLNADGTLIVPKCHVPVLESRVPCLGSVAEIVGSLGIACDRLREVD